MWKEFLKPRAPFWIVYVFVGWWSGSKLVAIPNLQAFKVLNILGLSADLCGIIILSRFILQNPRFQALVIGPIAEHLYTFFFLGVIGLLARSEFGATGPSTPQLQELSLGLFIYFVTPISANLPTIVEDLIPKLQWSAERKASALGGTLLVVGVVMQIWAAYLDLHSK